MRLALIWGAAAAIVLSASGRAETDPDGTFMADDEWEEGRPPWATVPPVTHAHTRPLTQALNQSPTHTSWHTE